MTRYFFSLILMGLVCPGCSPDLVGKCFDNSECVEGYLCNEKKQCVEIEQRQIQITVDGLPGAVFGTPYQAALTAEGGLSPYKWQVQTDMKWLHVVAGSAQLSGTPDMTSLKSDVTIVVTDSTINGGTRVTKTLPMEVRCETGVCCDQLGLLRTPDWKCAAREEYQCSTEYCGAAAQDRSVEQYCSGKSIECDGDVVKSSWNTIENCHALEEACETDKETYARCKDCTSTLEECRFTGVCGKPYNKLEPSVSGVGFGSDVAIGGDVAFVGAPYGNEGKGLIHVYKWVQQNDTWRINNSISKENTNGFGRSFHYDGDSLIVKSDGSVFVVSGAGFETVQELIPKDIQSGDEFGESIYLSGEYAVVGAPSHNATGYKSGAVIVFKKGSDNTWKQVQRLSDPDTDKMVGFGKEVSIYGEHILVASWDTMYFFRLSQDSVWEINSMIYLDDAFMRFKVAVSGNNAIAGLSNIDDASGAAYSYTYENQENSWKYIQKFKPVEYHSNDMFAENMAIRGNHLAVWACCVDGIGPGVDKGGVYVFHYKDGAWTEIKSYLGGGIVDDKLGYPIDISDSHVIVSSREQEIVYIF